MMRKLLLLLVCFVASIGAQAESIGSSGSTYTYQTTQRNSKKVLTITLAAEGDLASALNSELSSIKTEADCVVITGKVNATDLGVLSQFSKANLMDISGIDCSSVTKPENVIDVSQTVGVVVPSSWDLSTYAQHILYKFAAAFKREGSELKVYTSNDDNQKNLLVDMLKYDKYDYNIFGDIKTLTFAGDVTPYNSPYVLSTIKVTANLINALNSTNYSIETVNLENGEAENLSISIQNTHIKTLNLSGLEMKGSTTLNIGDQAKSSMALENLNLSNVKVTNVDATNLETLQSINLKGANLTKIDITQSDGDYSGLTITVDSEDQAGKITPSPSSIWGDDVAGHINIDTSVSDSDGCYILLSEDGKEATVHATTAGHFKALFGQNASRFGDGVRFAFDNESVVNKDDLLCILKDNKYYVDLFNITNGDNTPMKVDDYTTTGDDANSDNIDKIVEAAVADMVTYSYQAKGIILPLNTGSGTSKMEQKGQYGAATFSEYAAYYRDTQKTAAIYSFDNQIQYNVDNGVTAVQNYYNTAYSHLASHTKLADAETIIVSTNNKNRIDLSNLSSSSSLTTKITIVNDELVFDSRLANIYVETTKAGKFSEAVANTGIKSTPCEQLVVEGIVNADDVKAVNSFNDSQVEGPHVYNMANTTGATADVFGTITNAKVEYVVLPNGMATTTIEPTLFSSSMTSLKAAIAPSSDKKKLSAYIRQAGSLCMARYYATGGSYDANNAPYYYADKVDVTDVILSGNVNASDINAKGTVGADGHWSADKNVALIGLNQEVGVLSFNLEKAVFADNYDMNFSSAGYEELTSVVLPTSELMTTIPAHCLELNKNLKELHIPYNFQKIEDAAFWDTGINHITTEDASRAEIDNGPLTYTLSSNIKQLGITPNPVTAAITTPLFPQNMGVLDIYSLAIKTPKCYKNVFPSNSCDGWGGFIQNMPYCRDKYYNGDDALKSFAVLHFPSQASYDASTGEKESTYLRMKQMYTDVNKVFTKKEQTGAVDANGDPILWPTLEEVYRTYNQASLGLTWNDWVVEYDVNHEVNGGQPKVTYGEDMVYTKASQPAEGNHDGDYDFDEYGGWHQLVLSLATYVEPDEKVEDEKVVREYEDAGWFTLCIPFNMTVNQVQQMLGVPASTEKIICKLDGEEVSEAIMPEIRQLQSVTRKKGTGNQNNVVTLRLTENLYANGVAKYMDFNIGAEAGSEISFVNAADDNCLIGGRPYVIKAYKRKGETIKGQNIGKYIMTRYADQFTESQSCVANGLYEQLGNGDLITLRFSIPYENHKVQAVRDGSDAAYLEYTADGSTKRYYYTMVGQFWQQALPQYSIYMSKGKWYRYTSTSKGYTWDPYKCIIMATQEIEDGHANGGGYRDNDNSNYPEPKQEGTQQDLLESDFYINFLDGRDDDDFDQSGTSAKYVFAFEDGVMEFDENGNETTVIRTLDGVDMESVSADGKVYNMAGQVVGNSLEGLSKGMYIVNGKKYIVK